MRRRPSCRGRSFFDGHPLRRRALPLCGTIPNRSRRERCGVRDGGHRPRRPARLAVREEPGRQGAGARGGRRLPPPGVGRDHGVPRRAVPRACAPAARSGLTRGGAPADRKVRRPRPALLRTAARRGRRRAGCGAREARLGARGAAVPHRPRVRPRRHRLCSVAAAGTNESRRRARSISGAVGMARPPARAPRSGFGVRGGRSAVNVVLLHALPLDERMWEPQREALAGHEVTAPDLYRLGNSMNAWAEAVLAQVDGSFVACGASMGGYCGLAIARLAPERLEGLVLAGARAGGDSPERRAGRAATIELIRADGAAGLWGDMAPKLFPDTAPADVVERARSIALEQDPDGLVAAVEAIRDRPDSTELLASLSVPVLVAVGELDPFLTVDEARETAADARKGDLHVFAQTGHLPSR